MMMMMMMMMTIMVFQNQFHFGKCSSLQDGMLGTSAAPSLRTFAGVEMVPQREEYKRAAWCMNEYDFYKL